MEQEGSIHSSISFSLTPSKSPNSPVYFPPPTTPRVILMPTTRLQQAIQEGRTSPPPKPAITKPPARKRKGSKTQPKSAHKPDDIKGGLEDGEKHPGSEGVHAGVKRNHGVDQAADLGAGLKGGDHVDEPPEKKVKVQKSATARAEKLEKSPGGGVDSETKAGVGREADRSVDEEEHKPAKGDQNLGQGTQESKENPTTSSRSVYETGVIERGHIYFFYRPKVEVDHVQSIDDVRNFHMLLVPRPPHFAVASSNDDDGVERPKQDLTKEEETEMKVLQAGADAVPAPPVITNSKSEHERQQHYRVITIGKKRLPDPEKVGQRGGKTKEDFWATVTGVGDDLTGLERRFQEKEYETKTRGTRHEGPARLVARGAYAIVNTDADVPSKRTTHLGYYISHPTPSDLGDVQKAFGIYTASSFHIQVKNPDAPATNPQQAQTSKKADYPEWIMKDVFGSSRYGAEDKARRQEYGLRFACVETPELLDCEGAQLLLIASRHGPDGVDTSLGEDRGSALQVVEEKEANETIQKVFQELSFDAERFPTEPLQGEWI